MNTLKNRTYLIFITLLNLSILLAIIWACWGRAWSTAQTPVLENYLMLDAQQVLQWQQAEREFLVRLESNAAAIQKQRTVLIKAVFADELVLDEVHAARQALARLQNQQQSIVVEQLLAERSIATPAQRRALEELLLQQPMHSSQYEQLHQSK